MSDEKDVRSHAVGTVLRFQHDSVDALIASADKLARYIETGAVPGADRTEAPHE